MSRSRPYGWSAHWPGLPEHVRQAALVPTAYAVGTDFKPAPRQPLDTVLHVDRW